MKTGLKLLILVNLPLLIIWIVFFYLQISFQIKEQSDRKNIEHAEVVARTELQKLDALDFEMAKAISDDRYEQCYIEEWYASQQQRLACNYYITNYYEIGPISETEALRRIASKLETMNYKITGSSAWTGRGILDDQKTNSNPDPKNARILFKKSAQDQNSVFISNDFNTAFGDVPYQGELGFVHSDRARTLAKKSNIIGVSAQYGEVNYKYSTTKAIWLKRISILLILQILISIIVTAQKKIKKNKFSQNSSIPKS